MGKKVQSDICLEQKEEILWFLRSDFALSGNGRI